MGTVDPSRNTVRIAVTLVLCARTCSYVRLLESRTPTVFMRLAVAAGEEAQCMELDRVPLWRGASPGGPVAALARE